MQIRRKKNRVFCFFLTSKKFRSGKKQIKTLLAAPKLWGLPHLEPGRQAYHGEMRHFQHLARRVDQARPRHLATRTLSEQVGAVNGSHSGAGLQCTLLGTGDSSVNRPQIDRFQKCLKTPKMPRKVSKSSK